MINEFLHDTVKRAVSCADGRWRGSEASTQSGGLLRQKTFPNWHCITYVNVLVQCPEMTLSLY